MDVSGIDLSPYGMTETDRTALTRPNDFNKIVARNIDEQQAEKEQAEGRGQAEPGLSFPGQLSREEKQRIENLKSQAMQIASQGEDGLTAGQMSQIKAIEQEISNIGDMPMSENLMEKAKGVAEANQKDKVAQGGQAEPDGQTEDEQAFAEEMLAATGDDPKGDGGPGMAMLRQRALVTAIKGFASGGAGLGAA